MVADISGAQNDVAGRLKDRAFAVHAGVTSSADVRAMLSVACERFGGIDVLCNNAGIDGDVNPIADVEESNYERIMAVYGASKAGINQLTKTAVVEYAADKIRVNAICPGGTETPLVLHLMQAYPEMVARSVVEIPMGRMAKPAEIANAALFLACDESSFITGVALPVDGGCSAP